MPGMGATTSSPDMVGLYRLLGDASKDLSSDEKA